MEAIAETGSRNPGFWKTVQGNLIFLLLLLLVPTTLIQAYIYHERVQTRRAKELETNLEVARATAGSFEIFLQGIVHGEGVIGSALSGSQPIHDRDRDRILHQFQADNPALRSVLWVDPGGRVIASSHKPTSGVNVGEFSYFQKILAGRGWAVGELLPGEVTGEFTFYISRGIRDERGELLGVVAAAVDSARLDSVIRMDRSEGAGVSLIDNKGMHVFRNPATELSWERRRWLVFYPVIELALQGKEVTATVTSELTGEKRLAALVPVPSIGWVAAASRAEEDAMAAITSALAPQTFLVLIVTMAAFGGALLLSRSIATPIRQLRNHALHFGRSGTGIPGATSGPSELKDLAESFREMAEGVLARESELLESEEKFKTLFRSVPEALALALWDDATILEANEAYCELLGFSQDEAIGKTFLDLGIWADLSERSQIRTILSSETGLAGFECGLRAKSGQIRTVLLSVKKVDLQRRQGMLVIMRDITERKQGEEALRAASRYARSLIEASLDPLVTISPDGKITDVNAATETVTGRDRSQLIGTDFSDYFTNPDEAKDGYQAVFRVGSVRDYPLEIQHLDGHATSVLYNASVYRDGKGQIVGVFAAARDITERKRAEAERMKLERQIRQSRKAESLARMAGAIAHHFNNKLMAVSGNIELALNYAKPYKKLSARLLEAQRATLHAAEVSNLMLAYLGQALPIPEPFDLAEVCREVIEAESPSLPRGVNLKTDIPPHGPTIKANQAQARQILSNLLVNAWEAIGEGSGEIRVVLHIAEKEEMSSLHIFPADWRPERGAYACLEVYDTGCGIPPEHLDLLFDPFFSTKFTGRGLGLPVVLGAVRSYGGAIAVESKPGQGSVFRVFWPVEEQGAQPLQPLERELPRPVAGGGLILFVDDEPQLRNMAEAMLEHSGFRVITASHGLGALEVFSMRKDEISLVILDLTMPGMNGWETMEALRALRPDIPVILSSGYDEAKVMEGEHAETPQAFLHKPYLMADLKTALVKAMGASSPEGMKLRHDAGRLC